jgi:CBS domain-containing protein
MAITLRGRHTMHEAEHTYPALTGLRVIDAMHPGLISCALDSPLSTVARMMGTHRVHAILVTARGDEATHVDRP